MFNKKGTKRSLLMSALALLMCVSMLIGSTFAWFTDSVVSANNIIKSGTLEVSMMWADGKEEPASANWQDASTTKIFNYDKWEPGYTEARHIAVTNEGTLALKYQLTIVPTGEVSKLADVIDVYYIKTATQLDERADLSAYTPVGTLTQLINNEISAVDVMPNGKLAAGEGFTATLVLKMRESADNEYQNLSIGTNFSVQLLATQLTKENDSYGPDYDEDAWMDGMQVFTPEDLQTAINNGENPILQNDIELTEALVIPAAASTFSLRATPVYTVINLNGFRLTGTGFDANGKAHMVVNNGNAVIKNGTIAVTGANGGAALYNAEGASMILEDVTVTGASQTGSGWPSYAVQNYGVMEINGAVVGSTHGALALYGDTVINDATVTMNGFGGSSHVFYIGGEGTDVIINGGTYTHKGNVDGSLAYIMTGATMTVNGGTFSASNGGYGMATYTGSLTVNGGTFANAFLDWGGPISIAGGTFATKPGDKYIAEGFKVVETAAGYEVVGDSVDVAVTNATGLAEAIAKGGVVFIASDIDMNNAWTSVVPANGLTILGNNHTITNLNQPLLAGKGGPVVTVKGLTIADSNVGVAANENGLGTGAFMAFADHSGTVVFEDCHLLNSTVTGNERAAAFVAYSYANLTIKDCSVEGCTIKAVGSTAGLAAHVNGNTTIENSSVKNTKVTATEDRTGKAAVAGAVVGTINNNTAFTNVTASNNTVSNTGATPACEEVGRIVSGVWTVDGASYKLVAEGLFVDPTSEENDWFVLNAAGLANVNAKIADKSLGQGASVTLLDDIDFSGKVWTTVDSHVDSGCYISQINGNGHTISNLTVNGQAMFSRFAGFGDVVIKDITFDNANVNSNGNINTAILTVQTYQNVLLDNVDVKNSTITGGYKVAPLIGTVYNENESSITAVLKNCDVDNVVVTATSYDFCTTGMVAFVYADNNDKIEFENCTVSNVKLYAPNVYTAHAAIYTTGSDTLFNEAEGVTVTNVTFENK